MVEELDTKHLRGRLQGRGELHICLARCRIADRMIVGNNDCISLDLERLAEYFAQLNRRCAANVPKGDENRLADWATILVDWQNKEPFIIFCNADCRAEKRIGVIWRLNAHGSIAIFNRFQSLQTVNLLSGVATWFFSRLRNRLSAHHHSLQTVDACRRADGHLVQPSRRLTSPAPEASASPRRPIATVPRTGGWTVVNDYVRRHGNELAVDIPSRI